jgi:hypothetical protein
MATGVVMRNGTQDAELEALLREQQRIAKQIEYKRSEQLRNLHAQLGFASTEELIEALQSLSSAPTNGARGSNGTHRTNGANGSNGTHASNGASVPVEAAATRGEKAAGKGARYSDAVKAAVKSAFEKSEGTAREIASRYKVSLPTLNIWKKSWGLTKPRKKKRRAS